MRKLLLSCIFSFAFISFISFRDFAYVEPNSYKCSISEYHDCIVDSGCWGGCGRSPTAEGLVPICPTGYRCFCEDNDNNKDGVNECRCVECRSGCSDPFGYFEDVGITCPGPTCAENGYNCLPWGDSGCDVYNSLTFSCTWYNEACCTRLNTNYSCLGECNYPGQMREFPDDVDFNDESTYCSDGWEYLKQPGFDKLCAQTDGDGNIIGGSACCKRTADCPGMCSATCPPPGHPEFDGISLEYTCNIGLCCVDNSVEPPEKPEPYKGPVYNGPIIESLEEILNPVVRILYYGGLFVGIFFIILSGYKLMTSEGDPQRTKEAQEQLTSAIIGIIFILLSTTIIRIIISEIIGI